MIHKIAIIFFAITTITILYIFHIQIGNGIQWFFKVPLQQLIINIVNNTLFVNCIVGILIYLIKLKGWKFLNNKIKEKRDDVTS